MGTAQVPSPFKKLDVLVTLGAKPALAVDTFPYVVLSLGGLTQEPSFLKYLDVSVPIGGIKPDEAVVAAP